MMIDEALLRKILREEVGGIVREEVRTAFNEHFEPFKEFCIAEFERINGQAGLEHVRADMVKLDRRVETLENNHHYA